MSAPSVADVVGLVGTTVGGRYEVLREIGRGGMGVVYEARQVDLERRVAMKVLHGSGDPEAEERLLREARAAGAVGHPNLVDVYELGRLPDGRQYVVMPMLDGHDLATELCDRGPAPAQRVEWIVSSAARGLDVMHSTGLVHRDLKPENLFVVVHPDGTELLKILDFGLAARRDDVRLTQAGLTTGTPAYMSPEAADGCLPDRRGDVYSLATVAFEMLTGTLPFDADSPFRILQAKTMQAAPRLTTPVRAFSPEIEAVIARALARDPADRYGTAGEFASALARAVGAAETARSKPPVKQPTLEIESPIFAAGDAGAVRPAARRAAAAPEPATRDTPSLDAIPGLHRGTSRTPKTFALAAVVLLLAGGATWWALGAHGTTPATHVQTEHHADPPAVPPLAPLEPPPVVVAPGPATPVAPPAPHTAHAHHANTGEPTPPVTPPVVVANDPVVPPPPPPPHEVGDDGRGFQADPARAQELTRAGMSALVQGSVGAAADQLREATNAAPRYAPAWRGLGLAYERLGRAADAARAYRRYLDLAPSAPDATEIRTRVERLDG